MCGQVASLNVGLAVQGRTVWHRRRFGYLVQTGLVASGDPGGAKEDGDQIPRVIADAAALAVGIPFGPAGAFVAVATAPYLEAVAQWAWDKFGEDCKNRIVAMLARAWHKTGLGPLKFARRVGRNEQSQLLTATAMRGAATTAWPPRVAAIGDMLARGLIAEDQDEIDLVALALAAMAEMDRPHVSLLELLTEYLPSFTVAGPQAVPYAQFKTAADGLWHVGGRKWTAHQMIAIKPHLKPALQNLIGTLTRHGLVVENNEAAEALEESLGGFARRGQRQARQIRAGSRLTAGALQPHIPEVRKIIQTWSPTEFGEDVLGYYRDAAGKEQAEVADDNS
jgi:hypothetical protein